MSFHYDRHQIASGHSNACDRQADDDDDDDDDDNDDDEEAKKTQAAETKAAKEGVRASSAVAWS